MMTDTFYIDGDEAFATYGLMFKDGILEELLRLPERKPGYEYSWPDEDGTERDLSDPVFQSKEITLRAMLIGSTKANFITKYNALMTFLLSGARFNFDSTLLNRRFQLLYKSITGVSDIYFNDAGESWIEFTLTLIDDFPTEVFPIV